MRLVDEADLVAADSGTLVIGFVYQSHHLLPEFSALEICVLPQMIRGLARTEAVTRGSELLEYLIWEVV